MPDKPNILFIVVDEWRYNVLYESDELKEWRRKYLRFFEILSNNGVVFHRHYTNTNACVPARATIQTGQYPSIHGCKSTDAVGKSSNDPDIKWLPPFTVPTVGNYLNKGGYTTILKGKWHISDADICGLSGEPLPTFDINGNPIFENEEFYLQKNVLKDYGYEGWIGPEPHGKLGLNAASSVPEPKIGRDEKYINQTLETLDELKKSNKPWFLHLNLVDPHDIVLFGKLAAKMPENFEFNIDETLPNNLFDEEFELSSKESLLEKPQTQKNYRDIYGNVFQPLFDTNIHARYYYTLMRRVDNQLMRIWEKLITMPEYQNTIIVFTSDHGDLLGSHGGLQQKWYQAYDESIHVPLIISSPLFKNKHRDVYDLTSHIDLLPTFLDMAGIDVPKIRRRLARKFSLVLPLPGTTLLSLVFGLPQKIRPVYFYTEDNVTKGNNQINPLGKSYKAIDEPSCVEAIIAYIDGKLWKYTSYYSLDPSYRNNGICHELYNIYDDPLEIVNLHGKDDFMEKKLHTLLLEYSLRHRSIRNM